MAQISEHAFKAGPAVFVWPARRLHGLRLAAIRRPGPGHSGVYQFRCLARRCCFSRYISASALDNISSIDCVDSGPSRTAPTLNGQGIRASGHLVKPVQVFLKPRDGGFRRLGCVPKGEDDELVATHAREDIGVAKGGAQNTGGVLQGAIPIGMTEAVIDIFHIIQVVFPGRWPGHTVRPISTRKGAPACAQTGRWSCLRRCQA